MTRNAPIADADTKVSPHWKVSGELSVFDVQCLCFWQDYLLHLAKRRLSTLAVKLFEKDELI